MRIVLASSSPRRKELLTGVGLDFIAVESPYEEDMTGHTDPEHVVRLFSTEKARALLSQYSDSLIIAADTVVSFQGKVFGKPKSYEDAITMLTQLQGNRHTVYTGVTVLHGPSEKVTTRVVSTEITLAPLSSEEIRRYFEKVQTLDKAGAYAIQGIGATFTQSITGEYSNVVGLPLCALREMLKEFGIDLL